MPPLRAIVSSCAVLLAAAVAAGPSGAEGDPVFVPRTGTAPAPGQPIVIAAVGDGADGHAHEVAVASLIRSVGPNLVLYLGDVYDSGTPAEFAENYGSPPTPLLGDFAAITNPVIGNHEYRPKEPLARDAGYAGYWGTGAKTYAVDIGRTRLIALDSNCQSDKEPGAPLAPPPVQCGPGSPQYTWLEQELETHPRDCTIAFYHHPRFTSGESTPADLVDPLWRLLATHGVDLVLNGHDHNYQRFAPLDAAGVVTPGGTTQVIAGTGGHGHYALKTTPDPRLVSGNDTDYGAVVLRVAAGSIDLSFVREPDGLALDQATIACGDGADIVAPAAPRGVDAAPNDDGTLTVSWAASEDNRGVVAYDIVRDGATTPLGSTTGLTFTDTTTAAATRYTYVVYARDAAGNRSRASQAASATTIGAGQPGVAITRVGNRVGGRLAVALRILPSGTHGSWTLTLVPSPPGLRAVRGAYGATATTPMARLDDVPPGDYVLVAAATATETDLSGTVERPVRSAAFRPRVRRVRLDRRTLRVADVVRCRAIVGGWPAPRVRYQWIANGKRLIGLRRERLVIGPRLAGRAITCRVRATSAVGQVTAFSRPLTVRRSPTIRRP